MTAKLSISYLFQSQTIFSYFFTKQMQLTVSCMDYLFWTYACESDHSILWHIDSMSSLIESISSIVIYTWGKNPFQSTEKKFWMSNECSRKVHWNPDCRYCSVSIQSNWTLLNGRHISVTIQYFFFNFRGQIINSFIR